MDPSKTALFAELKGRMQWFGQRQEVIAKNIANADTPGYKPKDLKAFSFKEYVKGTTRPPVNMTVTDPSHVAGRKRESQAFRSLENRTPFETAPGGNAVVLEEQMGMMNETQLGHRISSELYKKHLDLFKLALRGGR